MARDVKRRHCPEHLWASITPWRDTWCLRCRRYRLPWWRRLLRQWQERDRGHNEPDTLASVTEGTICPGCGRTVPYIGQTGALERHRTAGPYLEREAPWCTYDQT